VLFLCVVIALQCLTKMFYVFLVIFSCIACFRQVIFLTGLLFGQKTVALEAYYKVYTALIDLQAAKPRREHCSGMKDR